MSPSRLPGLDLTLNPYQGCAHDCTYCYAPYLMRRERERWSEVSAKADLPRLLRAEASKRRGVIGLSTATDPYQPIEAGLRLTRRCLEELVRAQARVSVLTKSDLVVRDADLLMKLPKAEVGITITTSRDDLARIFEPGAPPPSRRLRALRELNEAGLDTYVFIGPIIPYVTDAGMDELMAAIVGSGCRRAMTDRLRLRPGMLARMTSRPGAEALGDDFAPLCSSEQYLAAMERKVGERCAAHGLRVQNAF
jgi:DNA repair photolyase